MSESNANHIPQPMPNGSGTWAYAIGDHWNQGKGAYGGFVMALFVRAMQRELDSEACPIRVLDCQFIQSVQAGSLTVRVSTVRQGVNVSFLTAQMIQGGAIMATATATFARPRARAEDFDFAVPSMPNVPAPADLPVAPSTPTMPQFTDRFEFRYAMGAFPFSGAKTAELGTWLKLSAEHPNDAVKACLLIDVLPPALFTTFTRFSPAATVSISCSFLQPFPLSGLPDDPYFLVASRTQRGFDGYSFETNELWSEDGRLVARATQVAAHMPIPKTRAG